MSNRQLSLDEVLYAFSLEASKPTAALIDDYRQRFPAYADAITEFATDLALDALRPVDMDLDPVDVLQPPSPAVMRAISHFQNARFQAAKRPIGTDDAPTANAERASPANPIGRLDATRMRRLADNLDVNVLLVMKLRDRQIVPDTIPTAFCQRVAGELGISVDAFNAHLFAPPIYDERGTFYKAVDRHQATAQETFADAVRASGLSPEQQNRLLNL